MGYFSIDGLYMELDACELFGIRMFKFTLVNYEHSWTSKCLCVLTDSTVRSSEPRGTFTAEPVDSIHTDTAIVTEKVERFKKIYLMRLYKSHILPAATKPMFFVSLCGGGHKAQFNSSIQASTFQMLIGVSSPSFPCSHHASVSVLLKALLPPGRMRRMVTYSSPLQLRPTNLHSPWGRCPPPPKKNSHLSLFYSISQPPARRDASLRFDLRRTSTALSCPPPTTPPSRKLSVM